MTTLAQRGAPWLARKTEAAAGEAVLYERGEVQSDLIATPLKPEQMIDAASGLAFAISHDDLDWNITANAAFLDVFGPVPQRGDRIVRSGFDNETYEVLPLANEECWNWVGTTKSMFRIHSRRANKP